MRTLVSRRCPTIHFVHPIKNFETLEVLPFDYFPNTIDSVQKNLEHSFITNTIHISNRKIYFEHGITYDFTKYEFMV